MQSILLSARAATWIWSVAIVVGVIALLFLIFFIAKKASKKSSKKETVKVDDEFIEKMLSGLGNLENISDVSIDNGRVKFAVNDLDLVKADLLKELSTSGVFITGKNVKLLFKYDSEAIVKLINERRK